MHHDKPLKKSELKELYMSHKLHWRQTLKCKSRSVYHNSSKSKSRSAQNIAHLDNPIHKVTMTKTIYLMSV